MRDNAPWSQVSRYCQEHRSGARVVACNGPWGWRFLAYGPDRAAGWDYRAWRSGQIAHWSGQEPRVRYQCGEPIPQPRQLLGGFDTAAEARVACEAHVKAKDQTPSAGDATPTEDFHQPH